MAVIAAVLLGLLGTLGSTANALTAGRQRTLAISLGKQAIETLQGAAYADVAMKLTSAGLSADPKVTGTAPNQKLLDDDAAAPDEVLVSGGSNEYAQKSESSGATFVVRTFVTAVPTTTTGYRRITVLVSWNPNGSTTGQRVLQFSSLVYPLDYSSYPSSSGSAEATGGSVTVTGNLAGDTFGDLHVLLPGVRASTNSSTLRTALGSAQSPAAVMDLGGGSVTSATCPTYDSGTAAECLRTVADSVADNDENSTSGNSASAPPRVFTATTATSRGGTSIVTAAGSMTSTASADVCVTCTFSDGDGLPWTEASLATSSQTRMPFDVGSGTSPLTGTLWDMATGWSASNLVDHDAAGGGVVSASARLTAPAAKVFDVDMPSGDITGFDGVVKIGSFDVAASATSGYTAATLVATSTAPSVNVWSTSESLPAGGYQAVALTPGTAVDQSYSSTLVVGTRTLTITARVQARPSTKSVLGTTPRADAVAQFPSLLTATVTVDSAETAAPSVVTDSVTIVFDYGSVAAQARWLVGPA